MSAGSVALSVGFLVGFSVGFAVSLGVEVSDGTTGGSLTELQELKSSKNIKIKTINLSVRFTVSYLLVVFSPPETTRAVLCLMFIGLF